MKSAAMRRIRALPSLGSLQSLLTAALAAAALPLTGCLFGGEEDAALGGDVQPGLYRVDYAPHFGFLGVADADSFGVTTTMFLGEDGTFRVFLADTLYAGPVPLLDYAGIWSQTPTLLVQSRRAWGGAFPNDGSLPGQFFYEESLPVDSAPVRAATASSFGRYEDDLVTGLNLWMSYRRIGSSPPLAGRYVQEDSVLDADSLSLARREVLDVSANGSFSMREYYGGALLVETRADSWLQPGDYLFAVNPRRRFYDSLGAPGAWDTLYGDWVLTLRNVDADGFERLDLYAWTDPFVWTTFRREAVAITKPAAESTVPMKTAARPSTPRRPARFDPAGPRWIRSAAPAGAVGPSRIQAPARTGLPTSPAGGLPPTAPGR